MKSDLRNQIFVALLALLFQNLLTHDVAAQETPSAESDTLGQTFSAYDILTSNTPEERRRMVRRYQFVNNTLAMLSNPVASGSDLEFRRYSGRLPLYLTPEELQEITPVGPDPLGEELRRRYSHTPPVLPITPLISRGIKALADQLTPEPPREPSLAMPIPTDLEIEVLKRLWTRSVATPGDIYAEIDTSWAVTAEDLHHIMEDMVARGFVGRRKISPSHEFNLFGLARIEMSARNRKNRLYLYWPTVSKDQLVQYLEAKRYLHASGRFSTNGLRDLYAETLAEKLYRLVRED